MMQSYLIVYSDKLNQTGLPSSGWQFYTHHLASISIGKEQLSTCAPGYYPGYKQGRDNPGEGAQ